MISGTMPKWQRIFHTVAGGFMAILAGGFGLLSVSFLFRSHPLYPGLAVASFAGFGIAAFGVGAQFWFRNRLVTEFSYDGRALRFRTLGRAEIETHDLSEIAEVGEWRGRGGPLGYKVRFRTGGKVYLQYSVSNSVAAAEWMRNDLGT